MVKAVLFDFWGTLIENGIFPSPVRQVRYILRIQEDFQTYIPKFEQAFMLKKFENLTEAFNNVIKEFNLNIPSFVVDKLVGMWNKNRLLAKPFPETIKLLEKLKKEKYKLALLSNTDAFSVEPILEKYDMNKYFKDITLSYQVGMLKTEPKMYEHVLKKLKVKKEDAVMIGDSMETDIQGAEAAGIKAVLVDRRGSREYKNKVNDLSEIDKFLK